MQILIMATTVVLMTVFSLIISRTALGRAQRACEQDRKMAALCGVNVDRTISITFVIGAALAAVAGFMFLAYYGVIDFFVGFVAGIKAFTAAVLGGIGSLPGAMLGGLHHRPDRGVLGGLFQRRIQGCGRIFHPRHRSDLSAVRAAWPPGSGEGLADGGRRRRP